MYKKSIINKNNAHIFFMLPGLFLFFVFSAYPLVQSFLYSFQKKIGNNPGVFVLFENYTRAFKDVLFIKSLWNILVIFIIHAPLMIFLSLVLAYILNEKSTKLRNLFRTVLFVPNVANAVAYTLIFKILFANDGIINKFLDIAGIAPVMWSSVPFLAKIIVSAMIIWRWMGYNMVVFLATMQSIPDNLYEAAAIDGASKFKQFFKITVPLMKNPILFTTIMTVSGTLGLFAESQLLFEGGPNFSTYTPTFLIYNVAWSQFNFGYASALSYILSIITIIIAFIQFKVTAEKEVK